MTTMTTPAGKAAYVVYKCYGPKWLQETVYQVIAWVQMQKLRWWYFRKYGKSL
jgi:hypothetical protein